MALMGAVIARSVEEVCALLADDSARELLAGGTDYMVEVNYRHRRPGEIVVIDRIPELCEWRHDAGHVEIGAGVTYREMERSELASLVPALAQAARTVGSPQIRNAGTLGGNLGTASPAGDTLPVLAALDATIQVRSARGSRVLTLSELIVGVKRTTLEPDEIIVSVRLPVLSGPQEFLKIGPRNAMVISVASLALIADTQDRRVRVALGSVSATPARCVEAEAWVTEQLDWDARAVSESDVVEFGRLAAAAATPIDDHRSTAAYRSHGVEVLARRALRRAFPEVPA